MPSVVACRAEANVTDWRSKARPIRPGGQYPAKEYCSQCGLCDTYYVAKVNEACAFLGKGISHIHSSRNTFERLGMSRVDDLETVVHGRQRLDAF